MRDQPTDATASVRACATLKPDGHIGPDSVRATVEDCYVKEFYFRYNNRVKLGEDDPARTVSALRGIVGKRLVEKSDV